MKILFLVAALLLWAEAGVKAQTNMSVTSTEVKNILLGSYNVNSYAASTVINDPGVVAAGLLNDISADSLKADLFALNAFYNRNMFSDTTSNTTGIGATRRWIYNKFNQYSQANDNRLRPSYLKFTYAPSTYGCSGV